MDSIDEEVAGAVHSVIEKYITNKFDEEVIEAVHSVIEKYITNEFDEELYENIYTETIMIMKDKDYIESRYGYAYKVAKNLIKDVLAKKLITAIKQVTKI